MPEAGHAVTKHREVRLVRHPVDGLRVTDLQVVDAPMPLMRPGCVRVRNTHLSVDAAVRLRLDPVSPPGYLPAFAPGDALAGLAVGTVIESDVPHVPVGSLVQHALGFRTFAVVDPADAALGGAGSLSILDPDLAPPEVHLGVLGGTGLTAWAGIHPVAATEHSDTVWVSAAAGAVGSVAAQLARAHGCRVIGSAAGPQKTAYLRDVLGLDVAVDRRRDLAAELREAAPDGIDVYFDSVGGDHLRIALDQLRPFGRVALCGAIDGYDHAGPASAPDNLFLATSKNLTLRGFRAGAFADRFGEARTLLSDLWRSGDVRLELSVHHGLESAPAAIVALLAGRNTGKTIVVL